MLWMRVVKDKIHELSVERLETLNLGPDVDRKRKLADLEKQLKDVAYDTAVTLVARMDSVAFLRFFGVSLSLSGRG
jgi:hypothetical protein